MNHITVSKAHKMCLLFDELLFSSLHTPHMGEQLSGAWQTFKLKTLKTSRFREHQLGQSRCSSIQEGCGHFVRLNSKLVKTKLFLVTFQDLVDADIIVTTLSSSRSVSSLLRPGTFSHIILDEAAQALETEAIIPLVLADASTRVVSTHKIFFPFHFI